MDLVESIVFMSVQPQLCQLEIRFRTQTLQLTNSSAPSFLQLQGERQRTHIILLFLESAHCDLVELLHLLCPKFRFRTNVIQNPIDRFLGNVPRDSFLRICQESLVVRQGFIVAFVLEREFRHLLERFEPKVSLFVARCLVRYDPLERRERGIGFVSFRCRGRRVSEEGRGEKLEEQRHEGDRDLMGLPFAL